MSLPFPYQILSTFKVENYQILYLDLHLERIRKTIQFLKNQYGIIFAVDLELLIQQQFQQIEKNHLEATKVRVLIQCSPIKFVISAEPIIEQLPHIQLKFCQTGQQKSGLGIGNFKTTDRKYWEQNAYLIQNPNEDIVGVNDKGEVTETSRFSIFVQNGNDFHTPPLESGCLAGVYREYLLRQKYVELNGQRFGLIERAISKNDLTVYPVFIGNSVRGLLRAEFVEKGIRFQ